MATSGGQDGDRKGQRSFDLQEATGCFWRLCFAAGISAELPDPECHSFWRQKRRFESNSPLGLGSPFCTRQVCGRKTRLLRGRQSDFYKQGLNALLGDKWILLPASGIGCQVPNWQLLSGKAHVQGIRAHGIAVLLWSWTREALNTPDFCALKTCWLRRPAAARRCPGEGHGGAGTKAEFLQRACPGLHRPSSRSSANGSSHVAVLIYPKKKKPKNTASAFRVVSLGGHGNGGDAMGLCGKW